MRTKILLQLLIVVFLTMPNTAKAEVSGKPGSKFPNTCAFQMADVPQKDCSVSTYDDEAWYKLNTADFIANKLQKINFVGNTILVDKNIASNWTALANEISNCQEIKSGSYKIKVYDHFCCRLQYGTSLLSLHAFGKAIDVNIDTNPWVGGHKCKPTECDLPPCVLQAMKNNKFSWGGSWTKPCDGQHIEWDNGKTNISDTDVNVCTKDGTAGSAGKLNPNVTAGDTYTEVADIPIFQPTPRVTLPGLNFSEGKTVQDAAGTTFIFIPFLGEYLAAAYKYGVAIASIFAVVMIINAGFGIAMSGGSPEKINHSKTRIAQSLVGLFLAVGSYTLLYTINPNLVKFKNLKIQLIESVALDDIEDLAGYAPEDDKISTTPAPLNTGDMFCGSTYETGDIVDKKGKKMDPASIKADGPWPFYERIEMYTRKGKYLKPDLIIVHATAGSGFLGAAMRPVEKPKGSGIMVVPGGPGVHYVIDRNGDIVQYTLERDIAWSVKPGDGGGSDAAKRSISYEIVNLNSTCGTQTYQNNKKGYRYSGDGSELEYNKKKNVHPRCLDMKAISPEIKANTCKCSQKPLALKTSGQYGKCWEIFPEEQLKKVAWLTAQIAKRHNIPVVRPVSPATSGCPSANMEGVCWNHQPGIVGHSDIQNQTHGDPGPDFDWKHFLDLVKSNM